MPYCTVVLMVILLAYADLSIAQSESSRQAIETLLNEQVRHWNNGDLTGFMTGYWPSDSLMFIGSEITYGYDSTLARYRRRYPDQTSMGRLRFEVVSLDFLSEAAAMVVGKWFLKRGIGDANGHFTLLFRKIKDRWYIVKDHSS